MARISTSFVVDTLRNIHGDKYDYSKVSYTNAKEKITLVCPKHGEFYLTFSNAKARGCQKCSREKMRSRFASNIEDLVARAKEVHGDLYDYSRSHEDFKNMHSEVLIRDKATGKEFRKSFAKHIYRKQGLPEHGYKRCGRKFTFEEALERVREVHGDSITLLDYRGSDSRTKSTFRCNTHEEHPDFELRFDHCIYSGVGCPVCGKYQERNSTGQTELEQFIRSIYSQTVLTNYVLKGVEWDIYVPDKNLVIEYDGLYWHSTHSPNALRTDNPVEYTKGRALMKRTSATQQGLQFLRIFEDEWRDRRQAVEELLRRRLAPNTIKRIHARDCTVEVREAKEVEYFLNQHHIQGAIKRGTAYVLKHENTLVACLVVGRSRYAKDTHEIYRFTTSCAVAGGFSKLLSYFEKTTPDLQVLESYLEPRLFSGETYRTLKFHLKSKTVFQEWGVNNGRRVGSRYAAKDDPRVFAVGQELYQKCYVADTGSDGLQ